jgi:hypothetical protein
MNKLVEAHDRGDFARPPGLPATISRTASLPATTGIADPFLAFAASESGQDILGKLIRFSKGDYLCDKSVVPTGTDMVAAVDALVVGWVRWSGKQQVERRLGRVSDGFREPSREELGHLDESQWEMDNDGRPNDPWQKTRLLPLKRVSDGELFTLTLNGRGRGGEAVGRLAGAYGRSRNRTDSYPIIKLGVDAYEHKQYGRIKFPVLPIVGWRPREEFGELGTGGAGSKVRPRQETGGTWDGPADIPDYIDAGPEDRIPF